jgi:hypothetical protein
MHYGPLPQPPDIASCHITHSTSEDRALHHLVTVMQWLGEDAEYTGPDGWRRFDEEEAVVLIASIVDDFLTYLHDALGPASVDDAVLRSIDNYRAAHEGASPLPACIHHQEPDPAQGGDCTEQQIADAYTRLLTGRDGAMPSPADAPDSEAARNALRTFVTGMAQDPTDHRPVHIRLITELVRTHLIDGADPDATAADVLADVICGVGGIIKETS